MKPETNVASDMTAGSGSVDRPVRMFLKEFFTSFFGVITILLAVNLCAAIVFDKSGEWKLMSAIFLAGHIGFLVWITLFLMAITGTCISTAGKFANVRDQVSTPASGGHEPKAEHGAGVD
jgi:hypothetical protein